MPIMEPIQSTARTISQPANKSIPGSNEQARILIMEPIQSTTPSISQPTNKSITGSNE